MDVSRSARRPGCRAGRVCTCSAMSHAMRTGCATACSWRAPAGRWRSTRRWPFAQPTSRPARSATRTWCASTSALRASDWRSTPRASPRTTGLGTPASAISRASSRRRVCRAHRLHEVEIHHVDLGAAYTFAQTPEAVLRTFFDRVPAKFAGTALDPCRLTATDLGQSWAVGDGSGPHRSRARPHPWSSGQRVAGTRTT